MSSAVIIGFTRSPFTPSHKGQLAKTRGDDIATQVVKGLVEKNWR